MQITPLADHVGAEVTGLQLAALDGAALDALKRVVYDNGVAVIRYGPAGTSGAQLLGFHFPGAVLVNDGRSGKVVEVSIGKDFDKLQGESEIAAAMASPSPSTKGPGCASPGAAPTASASAPASSSEPSSS